MTRTRFGGSEALPEQKIERDPWLKRMFAGYAFALDYRDRRGHAYMLFDQERTRRVTERPQPGSCLHCHSSVIPTYRRLGGGDMFKGFEAAGEDELRGRARGGREDRFIESRREGNDERVRSCGWSASCRMRGLPQSRIRWNCA